MDKFVDDIGTVRVTNGLVRIQTVRRIQPEGGEQRVQERGDLIFPMSAFLSLHTVANRAVEQMVEQGILTRKAGQDAAIGETAPEKESESTVADAKSVSGKAKK
jgi:hypothetical protein